MVKASVEESREACRVVVGGIALQWVGGRVGLAVQDVRLGVRGPGAAIDQAGGKGNMLGYPPKLPSEKGTQQYPGELRGIFQLSGGLSQEPWALKERQGNRGAQLKRHRNGPHSSPSSSKEP